MNKSSYITKMFLLIALLMTVLTLLIGSAISLYLYKTVEKEVMVFNRALQKFATDSSSQTINRLVSLSKEVSYDSDLIQLLYDYQQQTTSAFPSLKVAEYLSNKITNNIWVTFPESNLITLHLLYQEGESLVAVSPRYSNLGSIPSLQNENREPKLMPIQEHEGKLGVQQYSFQISNPIVDPVNGNFYGYIILDISEKVLYDSYKDLQSEKKSFVITDQKGLVLSAKDKSLIGSTYLSPTEASLGNRSSGYLKAKDQAAILFYQQIGGTSWYLVQKTDTAMLFTSLKRMYLFIILLFSLSIIFILIILAQFRRKTAQPVMQMNTMLDAVANGDLSVRAEIKYGDEFGKMAQSFNTMVEKIDNLLNAVTETEKAKRLAELDFLRAQINPHFIYNTLSSIRFSIEMGQTQNASEMLFHFTKLLRSTLSRSTQFDSLKEEIIIIENYATLQTFRYPDGFILKQDILEETLQCEIPSFILQPLVENAIFHNEGLPRINVITITSRIHANNLLITIQDTGFGMKADDALKALTKTGSLNKVGLSNVQERIKLNYGQQYGLSVTNTEQVGTTILITIPRRMYQQREDLLHA